MATRNKSIAQTTKETLKALEQAQAICKENGMADPNAFMVVEVAKLWVMVRGSGPT